MADHSKIEWTETTWNPLAGCTHVSPGCDHCYAAREASGRLSGTPTYAGLARDGKFTGEVRLLPQRMGQPLRWRRPRRVFVNSMSDLFHDGVPDEFIAAVFAVMAMTPQHTYQVLTKRHGRMRSLLQGDAFRHLIALSMVDLAIKPDDPASRRPVVAWPLPNVWLGVSVEDQKWAARRVPALLETPAAVRWLSCEPLLGPVDLDRWIWGDRCPELLRSADITRGHDCRLGEQRLHWVVAGGESGPGARPMHPDWARSLRDQCRAAGVPWFFKQWGEWAPAGFGWGRLSERERYTDETDELGMRGVLQRVGKRAAGRELDGRTWDEYPERTP